ncbi:MAG: hypothetical protein ACLFTK_00145 [Anaerolineales bacterium]
MGKTSAVKPKSYRRQFRFWLDAAKSDERDLIEYIYKLVETRQFAATIRDGLRLLRDLRARKTDVLQELFPWIDEHYRRKHRPDTSALEAKIERLEALLQAHPLPAPSSGGPRPLTLPGGGLKPLSAPPMPEDDATLLEIKTDTEAGKRAVQNMINCMFSLQNQRAPDWSKVEFSSIDEATEG